MSSPAYHTTACPYEDDPEYYDETKHHETCEWRQCSTEERAWHDNIVWDLKNNVGFVVATYLHLTKDKEDA